MFTFKMVAAGALVIGVAVAAPADQLGDEKRYSQLIDMMEFHNANFDDRQYWTYGCNCLMLGDRPMSEQGKGQPVDELDTVCKQYKDCLKCASVTHGGNCLGELIRYGMDMTSGPLCTDAAGTCGRDLCECDKMFAEDHVGAIGVYDTQYHRFYGNFDSETQCLRGGAGSADNQCCGADAGPKHMYNANVKQCCPDGSIESNSNQC